MSLPVVANAIPSVEKHVPFDEETFLAEILDALAAIHGQVQKIDERMARVLAGYHRTLFNTERQLACISPDETEKYLKWSKLRDNAVFMILKIRLDLKLDAKSRKPMGAIESDFGMLFQNTSRKSSGKKVPVHAGMA